MRIGMTAFFHRTRAALYCEDILPSLGTAEIELEDRLEILGRNLIQRTRKCSKEVLESRSIHVGINHVASYA